MRRAALLVLLLVGLPGIALAVVSCFYVADARRLAQERRAQAVRELGLDLADRLDRRLADIAAALDRGETPALAGLAATGSAAARPSGPSPLEQAYAHGRIPEAATLLDARARRLRAGEPAEEAEKPLRRLLAEAHGQDWARELELRLALERPDADPAMLASAWRELLPRLPADLARDLLDRMPGAPSDLREALAARQREAGLAAAVACVPRGPTWSASPLLGGGLCLVRQDGEGWRGAVLPPLTLDALLKDVSRERPAALGLDLGLALPAAPVEGESRFPVGSTGLALRLRTGADEAPAFYAWAVVILVAAVAAGSALLLRDVRRQAGEVKRRADLVSTMSHELKTPLTSIRMFVDTLLLGRTRDRAETEACLGHIARETDRLSRLIEQILTLARIEEGARQLSVAPESPQDVAEEALSAVQAEAQAAGITLACDAHGAPESFPMDRGATVEILTNLLSNAVKYSGGAKTVRLEIRPEGPGLRFDVVDQGPGIPEGEQARLFERFFRGSAAAASKASGTGLGLAIARALADRLGGALRLESAPGRGSRFIAWIPGTPIPPEAAHA